MRKIFYAIVMAALVLMTGACTQDEQPALPAGNITFAIAQASDPVAKQTVSRATPAQLGKPVADNFMLTIMYTGGIKPIYDGKFVNSLSIAPGKFDIFARCGENVTIGRDTPYYTGTTQVLVQPGKSASAVIPCRVANALISVRFGSTPEEKARLDKFYSDYAVTVTVGKESMDITSLQEATSIYFPAGSSPRLTFHGKLKALQGKEVSHELTSPSLPTTFQAADHGIVTITLPNPESSFIVEIGKAVMQTVTIEESLPVEWLPVPEVQATQVFKDGLYYGTTVTFSDTYPGATWKATLTNPEGTVVRTVSGTGMLTSDCHSEQTHPCLRAGKYTATYYIVQGAVEKKISTRDITILDPDLKLTVGGHTSYTKYQEGDIAGANACDAYTVYAPSASLNISEELLAKCPYTFTVSYEGQQHNSQPGKNSITLENQTLVKPKFVPYVLIAKATFAGLNLEATRQFLVTGLPGNFTPPTQANNATGGFGWVPEGPAVWFEPTYVQLGKNTIRGQAIINTQFAVPQGTSVQLDYDVIVRGGTGGTTLTLSMGNDVLFEKKHSAFGGKNFPYVGTKVFTVSADATQFKCNNSNGSFQNGSYINSIILKYAK